MTTQQTDIEKTLKRFLAREFREWRPQWISLRQKTDGSIWAKIYFGLEEVVCVYAPLCDDSEFAVITRAQWESERALLNYEQSQPLGDSEEFDQALWDKVAVAALAKSIGTYPDDSTSEQVSYCFEYADAFMSERAKRIAARKASHD